MADVNPIERRIGLLRAQYLEFIEDDDARLLRWRFASDERRMLDAFTQVEAREGITEDVILVLEHPFASPTGHGHGLVAELAHRYDLLRECLSDAGVADATWRPPRARAAEPKDIHHVRDTAASFHEHHQPLLRHLTLVLAPSSIADAGAYSTWLSQATSAFDDPALRLVVVEPAEVELFGTVAPVEHVQVQVADLDMPGALHEINAAGGLDSPQGKFRDAYLKMGDAVAAHDMPGAQHHADSALAIAQSQQWPHLVVATHYTLGAAYLGERQHPEAMRAFRRAEGDAETAGAAGAEWAPQLVLQARLAQGSVCVSTQSWPLGAETYGERALPVAKSMQDLRMQIECLRMAAYCNEQGGALQPAWDQSVEALGVGARMPEAERETTTLAYVGEALLRLCQHRSFRGREPAVETKMKSLLGPRWRPQPTAPDVSAQADVTQPSPLETSPPPVSTVPAAVRESRS